MPFGLTQGIYRVNRDAAGRATVMPTSASGRNAWCAVIRPGVPLELGAFTSLVRTIAGSRP